MLNLSTHGSRILFAKAKDVQYTISHKIMVNHERVRMTSSFQLNTMLTIQEVNPRTQQQKSALADP